MQEPSTRSLRPLRLRRSGTIPFAALAVFAATGLLSLATALPGCGSENPQTDAGDGPGNDRAPDATGDAPGMDMIMRPCEGVECLAPEFPCEGEPGAAAGQVTEANAGQELLEGPAAQGRPGDFFLRNDRVKVIVQGTGRAIGPAPYGGNIIDAGFVKENFDQFGEMSLVLQFGRTANFTRSRVVCDGSAGGPAVVQFSGQDAINDFINLPGLLPADLLEGAPDPNVAVGLDIAATYVLRPGATNVEVYWTFHNPGQEDVRTAIGTLTDTGGEVNVFAPTFGFQQVSLGIELFTQSNAVDHVAFNAPGPTGTNGISYGLFPRYEGRTTHQQFTVAGVHVMLFRTERLIEILQPSGMTLEVPAGGNTTHQLDFIVGRDPASVWGETLRRTEKKVGRVSGTVTIGGKPAANVRVALVEPGDGEVVTLFETDAKGQFGGDVAPGDYELVADQVGHMRSTPLPVTVTAGGEASGQDIDIPAPASIEYQAIDEGTGQPLPVKVSVIGVDPSPPDARFRDVQKESMPVGISRIVNSLSGTSVVDGPIFVEPNLAGQRYRVTFSHGPEYSVHNEIVGPLTAGETVTVNATLRRAVQTPGYVACDFHQHMLNSPDSPVPLVDRAISQLVEGTEFVVTTDHDYVTDMQPVVNELGVQDRLSTIPGLEITAWDYGHFNAYPIRVDPSSPNGGAIDWGRGDKLFNLTPAEIFEEAVKLGARVRQVNHPRAVPGSGATANVVNFQATWDRAGLVFDFANRTFGGVPGKQPVANSVLRLADDGSIFTPDIDAFEVYNGFRPGDSDGDGIREDVLVDRVLRDYMNLIAFGAVYTPIGASDTHTRGTDPAGLARTLVRVPDDSPAAIMAGLGDAVTATLNGSSKTPRDVVVTNAPFVRLDLRPDNGQCNLPGPDTDMCEGQSCVRQGGTLALSIGAGEPAFVAFQITVETPSWAQVDTIELFANQTFDRLPTPDENGGNQPDTALTPTVCFSTLKSPGAKCLTTLSDTAPFVSDDGTTQRMVAQGCLDLRALPRREGAQGDDSWLIARASGVGTLFPVIPEDVSADPNDLVDPATFPENQGVFPLAFTSAALVDVDGNGWRGPFEP